MNDPHAAQNPKSKGRNTRWGGCIAMVAALAVVAVVIVVTDAGRDDRLRQPSAPIEISIKYAWIKDGDYLPTMNGMEVRGAHAYVVAHDPNSGRSYVARAGPEQGCDDKEFELTVSSRVSSIESNVRISSRVCPRFCRESVSGLKKLWAIAYEGTDECGDPAVFVQPVARVNQSFSHIVSEMRRLAERNNQCNENRYRAVNIVNETNNSNSFAFEVVKHLTGTRPTPRLSAPDLVGPGFRVDAVHGWNNVVGDNGVSCLGGDRFSLSEALSACEASWKWYVNPIGPSYNYCELPPNRWIGGDRDRFGDRIRLVDVIRQTSAHLWSSDSPRLQSLAKAMEYCHGRYWDRPFYRDDYCWVRVASAADAALWGLAVGEHRVPAQKVLSVSARAAAEFSG